MTGLTQLNLNHTDIVVRMRSAFLLMVLLLSASGILGGYQLSRLYKSQRSAIEFSVPTLAKSQEFESYLAKIIDFSARLGSETSEQKILASQAALIELSNHLDNNVESANFTSKATLAENERLRLNITQLNASARKVVFSKLKIIFYERQINSKTKEVARLREKFNQVIEPLSIDLATNLDKSLNSLSSNSEINASQTINNLKPLLNAQQQLLEISTRLSALLDTIERLSPHSSKVTQISTNRSLEVDFRRITHHLVNISGTDSRTNLAKIVKQLRVLVFNETGLLNDISLHRDIVEQFNEAHISLLTIVNTISDHIDNIVKQTRSDIDTTTVTFNNILNQTVIILGVLGITVLFLIALINHFVIERQFNRRISTLISAVTDIAKGDTDRTVGISGQDEIALMADALEIFKDNAKELRRSNHELEQFAYAASHDLKSPLKAIENLAQWILEDTSHLLPDESRIHLHQLLSRAQRLSQLQSDLLEYSRADRVDSSVDHLDLSSIASELSEFLDPEDNFTIMVKQGPEHLISRITPLRQILLNLVGNAIKHHDRTTGTIEISTQLNNNKLLVTVADDGPGIPLEYQNKIFELFEKLESKDLVEGSGLGLSLVKKLVEQSKGTISVTSDPNTERGCTFEFEWSVASV